MVFVKGEWVPLVRECTTSEQERDIRGDDKVGTKE